MAHNKLSSLPASLCEVTSLVWLNAKSNNIRKLHGNVRQWTNLQVRAQHVWGGACGTVASSVPPGITQRQGSYPVWLPVGQA